MNKWCLRILIATLVIVNTVYWGIIHPVIHDGYEYEITPETTQETIPYEKQDFLYYDEALGAILDKEEEKVTKYTYGTRVEPTVNIDTSNGVRNNTYDVNTTSYEYMGKFNITGYTPGCEHCCGNTEGITASGVEAIPGYSAATSPDIPFGTTLYIEGYGYYVVEDRGAFGDNIIDIAAASHEECYTLTDYDIDVYIVP